MKASWTRRGKKTYQPIRTEFSTRRSVNSVYKETEDTHTHTLHTHTNAMMKMQMKITMKIIKNNRICFSPQ